MKGVTGVFNNLPDDLKQKYHYDPFAAGLNFARKNKVVYLNKNLAFSLDKFFVKKLPSLKNLRRRKTNPNNFE